LSASRWSDGRYLDHIARPGREPRHRFLYRIRDVIEIASFLYDAMDSPRQRPRQWK
jgi:hypothetical protein